MNKINAFSQTLTCGVIEAFSKTNNLGDLWVKTIEEFKKQPDKCFDGGNDKSFFSFFFKSYKLFAAVNEINGLTIMLPEEY